MAGRDPTRVAGLSAWSETLPPEKRGAIMLGLLANAIVTLALQAAWLLLLFRALMHAQRRGDRTAAVVEVAKSRPAIFLAVVTVVHSAVRRMAVRLLEDHATRPTSP